MIHLICCKADRMDHFTAVKSAIYLLTYFRKPMVQWEQFKMRNGKYKSSLAYILERNKLWP